MKIKDLLNTASRQATQGATFGAGDELKDYVAALYASKMTGMPFDDFYKEARSSSVAELANDWKDAPVTSFVSNIAGGIPLGATRPLQAATNWAGSGNTVGQIFKTLGFGSGLGAAGGYASGEGDTRGSNAAFGAVVGGPLALVGLGASKLAADKPAIEQATDKVSKGYKTKAEKFVAEQLASRPDLAKAMQQAEKLDAAAKTKGVTLTTAEKLAYGDTDPLIAQQAILGGKAQTGGRIADLYKNRSGQIEKAYEDVAGNLSPAGTYDEAAGAVIEQAGKAKNKITGDLVAKANPLYEEAFTKSVNPNQLKNLADKEPIVSNAIKAARADERFAGELKDLPDNSIRVLNAAKKIIDESERAAQNPITPKDSRPYANAREMLLALTDRYAPSYAEARKVYSGQPDKLVMRERLGPLSDFDPNDPKAVANALMSGTQKTAQVAADALGEGGRKNAAAAVIRNALETNRGSPESVVRKLAPNDRTAEQLSAYAGDAAPEIDTVNELARRLMMGNRVIKGSPTQPLQESSGAMKDAATGVANLAVGNKVGFVRKLAQMLGRGSEKDDPQFYEDMYRLMTTDEGMNLAREIVAKQGQTLDSINTVRTPITAADVVKGNLPVAALPAKSLRTAQTGGRIAGATVIPQIAGQMNAEPLRLTVKPSDANDKDTRKAELLKELKKQQLLEQLRNSQ